MRFLTLIVKAGSRRPAERRFQAFLTAAALPLMLLLSSCGDQHEAAHAGHSVVAEANGLVVTEAWLQLPPRAAPVAAGYLQMTNKGAEQITLLSVASEQFGQVEMHETITENGMVAMRKLPEVVIAAGETVVFEPGGLHLMLMMAKAPVDASGDYQATLQLKTASGQAFQLPLPLEKREFGQQPSHSGH